VDLVRDLLDKPVFDRNRRAMGRVDGIVLELRDDRPPRVDRVEIGPAVLVSRLRPGLARWVEAFERAWGVADRRPVRISASDIIHVGRDVTVDVSIGQTGAENVEHKLRRLLAGKRSVDKDA
jgi:hypothetical protein